MAQASGGGGSVWEDGLGRRDDDAVVLSHDEADLTPDPQSVRYGEGRAGVAVDAVVGGPAFRGRAFVDVRLHEGLRPISARLTRDVAGRIAALLDRGAADAERGPSGAPPVRE